MKKLLSYLLSVVLVFACLIGVTACQNKTSDTKRMTVDINPSVEFILDSNNKVVSVTGLNDDGDVLISGEVLVGKTAEEATTIVVKLATQAGYITENDEDAEVSISISGYDKEVKDLYEKVKTKVNNFLNSEGVTAVISKVDAVKSDVLKGIVKKCYPEKTEEEINALTEEELLNLIKLSRIECAELQTEALRESYYKLKAYEFTFASYEKTAQIVSGIDGAYQSFLNVYNSALQAYQNAIVAIQNAHYEHFVDVDSDYQKALESLREKKTAILELEKQLAELEESDAIEQLTIKGQIAVAKTTYETAETTLSTFKNIADVAVNGLVTALKQVEQQLITAQESFPAEIKTVLEGKVSELESAMNTAKQNAFDKFEEKYADDIAKHNERLQQRKQELLEKTNN